MLCPSPFLQQNVKYCVTLEIEIQKVVRGDEMVMLTELAPSCVYSFLDQEEKSVSAKCVCKV